MHQQESDADSDESVARTQSRGRDAKAPADAPPDGVATVHRVAGNRAVAAHFGGGARTTTDGPSPDGAQHGTEGGTQQSADGLCVRCARRYRAGEPLDCPDCEAALDDGGVRPGATARRSASAGAGRRAAGATTSNSVPASNSRSVADGRHTTAAGEAAERTGHSGSRLVVSDPDDRSERQADRVADRVLRASAGTPSVRVGRTGDADLHRLCGPCRRKHRAGLPLDCEECERELHRSTERDSAAGAGGGGAIGGDGGGATGTGRSGTIGAEEGRSTGTAAGPATVDPATARRIESLRGRGRPLPDPVRSAFEPRFGADFGDVRVHDGPTADDLARSLDARAFTVGSDLVFRSGTFEPGSPGGAELLAHELTHVLQHRRGNDSVERIGRVPDESGVKDGRYSYSTHCGWIDWGHTNPGLARQLIAMVREASQRIGRREAALESEVQRARTPLVTEADCPYRYETGEREASQTEAPVVHVNESGDYVEIHVGGFGVNSRDSAKFEQQMLSVVQSLALFRQARDREFEIVVTGFSDCVGSDERNAELRRQRSTEIAMRTFMAAKSVAGIADITIYSEEAPLNQFLRSNATREGRRFNRGARIELVPKARPERLQTPQMASRAPVVGVVSGVTPTISLERSLSEEEIRRVALSVFMIQSRAFESLQGWTDFISESSFSEEDLPSNLISFYRAAEGYSSAEVRDICDAWDTEQSLEKLEGYSFTRNRTFRPPSLPPGGQWPSEFQQIAPVKHGGELFRVLELLFETPLLDQRCTVRNNQLLCD